MKKKSVGINALLNAIRQCLSILFPLITYPYAVRVLGAESLGKVNYAQSIVSYFALLAMLGVPNYVIREGSGIKEDKAKFQTFLNEVYTINILFTAFSYFLLFVITLSVPNFNNYMSLIFLQSISIILTTFGIDWINTIYEDFLKITIRSIVTYLVTILLLFLFVKSSNDYYIYSLLTVITNGIICISNRFDFRNKVRPKLTLHFNFLKHIVPLLILFANSLALTINTSFDVTMLGWFKGDFDVGIYSLPVRIISVIKSVFTAVLIVCLPRLSSYRTSNDSSNFKNLSSKFSSFIVLFTVPVSVGLFFTSEFVVLVMGGNEMLNSINPLKILAFSLIFSTFSGFIMNVMNISLKREKLNLLITVISALINVLLNFFFIPWLSSFGASITTLISEAIMFFLALFLLKNGKEYIDFKEIFLTLVKSFIATLFMSVVLLLISILHVSVILEFVLEVIFGILIYGFILLILKEKHVLDILRFIKDKFLKKGNEHENI